MIFAWKWKYLIWLEFEIDSSMYYLELLLLHPTIQNSSFLKLIIIEKLTE